MKRIFLLPVLLVSFNHVCLGFAQESPAKKYHDQIEQHFAKGEYKEAIALCEKAIEEDPKYLVAYFGRWRDKKIF
jgi:tetratricopeptide (TPR) repeat protein